MAEAEIASADDPVAIDRAVEVLQRGGLVVFPTDTVYGLAANLRSLPALERIYQVKGRPRLKAIPVLLSGASALDEVVQPQPEAVLALARSYWPGALTLVLRRLSSLPVLVSSDDTVAVRVPDHPFALALLERSGPLAVTSANLSGAAASRTAQQAAKALGRAVELIVNGGRSSGGRPSTIVDCSRRRPQLLREGPISLEQITQVMEQAARAAPASNPS